MANVKAGKARITGLGLVRDKNGKPKIDDYENCPQAIKNMLTDKERKEFENGTNTH